MRPVSLLGLVAVFLSACSERPESEPRTYPAMDSAGAALLTARCGQCHIAPQPSVHVAEAWPAVVNRMQMRMRSRGYPVLEKDEQRVLLDYLQAHAAPAVK